MVVKRERLVRMDGQWAGRRRHTVALWVEKHRQEEESVQALFLGPGKIAAIPRD